MVFVHVIVSLLPDTPMAGSMVDKGVTHSCIRGFGVLGQRQDVIGTPKKSILHADVVS